MVQANEQVNYQGRRAWVVSTQGNEPNQVVNIRFEDGTERIIMSGELGEAKGTGLSGTKLNEAQIAGHAGADRQYAGGAGEYRKEQDKNAKVDDYGTITPQMDEPVIDLGPGTGDTGAGLKADGKDVDSNNRRLLGTEEIITKIEPVTRKVVDKNGRKLEVGTTISIKARLIKFHGADKVEVLYPPYIRQSGIPIWVEERKRLELPNQDDPTQGSGAEYLDAIYHYENGQVVDANGKEAPKFEPEKQERLTIPVKYVEKF
jgi:hypothetical protein